MPHEVDFFFDFVSPYTYLAQTQLPALKTRSGAGFVPRDRRGHRSPREALLSYCCI